MRGLLAVAVAATAAALSPLRSFPLNGVTTSGISAGGFMASQFHVAYSSIVSGAALLAGGERDLVAVTIGLSSWMSLSPCCDSGISFSSSASWIHFKHIIPSFSCPLQAHTTALKARRRMHSPSACPLLTLTLTRSSATLNSCKMLGQSTR